MILSSFASSSRNYLPDFIQCVCSSVMLIYNIFRTDVSNAIQVSWDVWFRISCNFCKPIITQSVYRICPCSFPDFESSCISQISRMSSLRILFRSVLPMMRLKSSVASYMYSLKSLQDSRRKRLGRSTSARLFVHPRNWHGLIQRYQSQPTTRRTTAPLSRKNSGFPNAFTQSHMDSCSRDRLVASFHWRFVKV